MQTFRGRLVYKLVSLRLAPLQAYHVCSSLIVRKMEFPELSMDISITSGISYPSSGITYPTNQYQTFLFQLESFICFLHALYAD
jgi:hypothetical protein